MQEHVAAISSALSGFRGAQFEIADILRRAQGNAVGRLFGVSAKGLTQLSIRLDRGGRAVTKQPSSRTAAVFHPPLARRCQEPPQTIHEPYMTGTLNMGRQMSYHGVPRVLVRK
jgi:hypothetical protein